MYAVPLAIKKVLIMHSVQAKIGEILQANTLD